MSVDFKRFQRKGLIELREVSEVEIIGGADSSIGLLFGSSVSVNLEDINNGSPKRGDMIARNPDNHNDQWLVNADYFKKNYEPYVDGSKSLGNTDTNAAKKNVNDIVFWGNGDTFKLISKASSENEGWMKSTKALKIKCLGCVVQVTTQQGDNVAEAITFVPNAKIKEELGADSVVISRKLIF